MFFDLPRGGLGGSFGIPGRAKALPKRPKTLPRSAQDAPGRFKTPKTTPKRPLTIQRHLQDAPWEELGSHEGGFRGRSGCVSGFLLGSIWGRCGHPCWVGLEMFLYWFGRATLAERAADSLNFQRGTKENPREFLRKRYPKTIPRVTASRIVSNLVPRRGREASLNAFPVPLLTPGL